MSWSRHSQERHGEFTYYTFRCRACRAWLTVVSAYGEPGDLPKCSKGCRQ